MHSIGRAILQDKVPLHVHKNKGGKAIKKFHHFKKKIKRCYKKYPDGKSGI